MPLQVVAGAMLKCTFAVPPGMTALVVEPEGPPVLAGGPPAATIEDCIPLDNIPTFGMCMSEANPEVASATAAALGVLTPMPCLPVTTPWVPGSAIVKIDGMPALHEACTCTCSWGGEITITEPGQAIVTLNG